MLSLKPERDLWLTGIVVWQKPTQYCQQLSSKSMLSCMIATSYKQGPPWWLSGKESDCKSRRCRRCGLSPWVRKIPWRRKWKSTPVFWPEQSHGQRSLAGYRQRGHKESDSTKQLNHQPSYKWLSNTWVRLAWTETCHKIHARLWTLTRNNIHNVSH